LLIGTLVLRLAAVGLFALSIVVVILLPLVLLAFFRVCARLFLGRLAFFGLSAVWTSGLGLSTLVFIFLLLVGFGILTVLG
jgi:hypothetical protein